jgi:HEAT repeat protein
MPAFVAFGCVLFVGALWLLEVALEDRDPKYDGKTIDGWLAELQSPDASAASAARMTATNRVIPALRDRMFNDTNDFAFKLKLVDALNSLPWGNVVVAEASGRRFQAASQIGEFGTNAAFAIPDLIRCAKSQDFARGGAIEALGKVHAQPNIVVPTLIELLDDPEEDIQIRATEALTEIGPPAKPAVPKLIPHLKAHSKELPFLTKKALEAIDPSAYSTNETALAP